jgi:hypothetical protein
MEENTIVDKEYHGDLEVVVYYGGHGLVKARKKDVLGGEMPPVLRDLLLGIMDAVIQMQTKGHVEGSRVMPLYSDEQFDKI